MRILVLLSVATILWLSLKDFSHAFSGSSSKNPVRVLVSGATGKTGRLVLSKLENDYRYQPKGLVRTERSARNFVKSDNIKCPLEHVIIADVTSPTFVDDLSEEENDDADKFNTNGLGNLDAMVICTSAVPRVRKRSLVIMLLRAPWRMIRGNSIVDFKSMRFAWKHGGYPEKVDYQGQKAQIDLAKRLGIPHVVLVTSMGGTDPSNFLNSVGKSTKMNSGQEGHGDILLWKRRAEKYLVESGLDYTILHPGALVDTPGGREEFVLDVDDNLYKLNHGNQSKRRSITRISREDLAELCVAALSVGKGKQCSFDCITLPTSTVSSLVTMATTEERKDYGVHDRRKKNKSIDTINSATTSTTTSVATTAATASTTATATTVARKSAEDALTEFLELSITTNYDA